ncbi:hypothetical protein B0H17DRAFT_543391 [Mycena rosella]|uniref:Uncharacterized protein n=1 Tax=Mycena rosella TaxID=1033263 RepID=A0AAD7BSN9_MYCRO|nr:hypothetical protein B0H17DRAFT_543391 [Mycena rosella]
MPPPLHGKRPLTGHHPILPAMNRSEPSLLPKVPTYLFLKWTFGRGSVGWIIWPAVLLHTLFVATIVYSWVGTGRKWDISNVMLPVMGVVIGFVSSYRVMSAIRPLLVRQNGLGRCDAPDFGPHLAPGPAALVSADQDEAIGARHTPQEMLKIMAEKRMVLDLVERFAVALKHHLFILGSVL